MACLLAALFASGLRPDPAQAVQHPLYVAELLLLLLILLSTTLSASLLAFPDLHQKRTPAHPPAALFGLFILLLIFAWRADMPPAPFPVHSFECTLDITFISLIPAVLAFFVLRSYVNLPAPGR
ncbi:MAG: NrsF family protein [Sideroxyarcus sp.]|nr:NrsF family protein [Sideroxyarcus sp.]